jgi:hypothetical protein
MNKEIYLNFAVYNKHGIDYLVKVIGGNFASDAWMVSDEEFRKIVGRSFRGLFGDNGECSCCDKSEVRRLVSEDEYNSLRKSACLTFKRMEKTLSIMERILNEYPFADWRDKVLPEMEIHNFTHYGHEMFNHPLLNIDPENPEHDAKFEDLARLVMKLDK